MQQMPLCAVNALHIMACVNACPGRQPHRTSNQADTLSLVANCIQPSCLETCKRLLSHVNSAQVKPVYRCNSHTQDSAGNAQDVKLIAATKQKGHLVCMPADRASSVHEHGRSKSSFAISCNKVQGRHSLQHTADISACTHCMPEIPGHALAHEQHSTTQSNIQ